MLNGYLCRIEASLEALFDINRGLEPRLLSSLSSGFKSGGLGFFGFRLLGFSAYRFRQRAGLEVQVKGWWGLKVWGLESAYIDEPWTPSAAHPRPHG